MCWNENNQYITKLLAFTGLLLLLLLLLGKSTTEAQNTVSKHWLNSTDNHTGKLLPENEMLLRSVAICEPCMLESENFHLQKLMDLREKTKAFLNFFALYIIIFHLFRLIWKRYIEIFYSVFYIPFKVVIQYIENCDGKKKGLLFLIK